jgi:hypothetical protein
MDRDYTSYTVGQNLVIDMDREADVGGVGRKRFRCSTAPELAACRPTQSLFYFLFLELAPRHQSENAGRFVQEH